MIAETGAGQHGVATATIAALLGLECEVYMGEEDTARQALNVFRMELLGARVIPVRSGSRTLKDAMNEAIRDWVTNVRTTYYCIGSTAGPHPYPMMVRDLQSVIGREVRRQLGGLPDVLVACVGGGSNALGLFHPFLDDREVRLVGVEAAGAGLRSGRHGAPLSAGIPGVLHGSLSYLIQDEDGQILPAHSISAGLDYPGVGPEHSWLKDTGRAEYVAVTDEEALEAFGLLARLEGIIPALESAHAVAHAVRLAATLPREARLVIGLSGRGDKDVDTVRAMRSRRARRGRPGDRGEPCRALTRRSPACAAGASAPSSRTSRRGPEPRGDRAADRGGGRPRRGRDRGGPALLRSPGGRSDDPASRRPRARAGDEPLPAAAGARRGQRPDPGAARRHDVPESAPPVRARAGWRAISRARAWRA